MASTFNEEVYHMSSFDLASAVAYNTRKSLIPSNDEFGDRSSEHFAQAVAHLQAEWTGANAPDFGTLSVDGKAGPKTTAVWRERHAAMAPDLVTDMAAVMAIKEATSQFEGHYWSVNRNGEYEGKFGKRGRWYNKESVGLSWGCVQFTQYHGNLGKALKECHEADPEAFRSIFGPDYQELLDVTNHPAGTSRVRAGLDSGKRNDRVMPVAGADLWRSPWVDRFIEAGRHRPFQLAQERVALREYLLPVLSFADEHELTSQRALAMLFDRSVHMGPGGCRSAFTPRLVKASTVTGTSIAMPNLTLYNAQQHWTQRGDWWAFRPHRLYRNMRLGDVPLDTQEIRRLIK